MKFKPLQDWVLVREESAVEKSRGGIYIPDTAREKTQIGEVVAVGEGKFEEPEDKKRKPKGPSKERTFVKTVLKPGQRVFYEKYGATRLDLKGEEYVLIREGDVLGIMG